MRFWTILNPPTLFSQMVPYPLHDHDYSVFVQVLRDLRLEIGITQVELAERLQVDQSLISKVERRERRLDVAELRRVCVALGVPLTDFVLRFEQALALESSGSPQNDLKL